MKKTVLFLFCLAAIRSTAQKQSFDIITYTSPANWSKEVKENIISYSITDRKKNTWCQIGVAKSTVSKGGIEADFESEWRDLVVKNYNPAEAPQLTEVLEVNGWKILTGAGKFIFNNNEAVVMLTTASGSGRCASIVAITNSQDYMPQIEAFLSSVELAEIQAGEPVNVVTNNGVQTTGAFAFNTTNFDDGWTSTIHEDWVEVVKGNIKVLLHYPKEGTIFPADPEPLITTAWNILVAPRYSDLKNYKTTYISTYDRPYLGMGYATQNATGKNVFIVLFRRGQSGWLEVICPDKNSFIQQFKFDPETIQWDSDSDLLNSLLNMTGYNKFAVAASDFKGKWTSDFTGIQQLYNIYTGQYAGMNVHQSNEEFVFGAGNSYNWKLLAVNGMVGNVKFDEVKSSGQFNVVNNWQIRFSKIEDRARTYNAFWSCIKGARILNLLDADSPGSGMYTKYGLAK